MTCVCNRTMHSRGNHHCTVHRLLMIRVFDSSLLALSRTEDNKKHQQTATAKPEGRSHPPPNRLLEKEMMMQLPWQSRAVHCPAKKLHLQCSTCVKKGKQGRNMCMADYYHSSGSGWTKNADCTPFQVPSVSGRHGPYWTSIFLCKLIQYSTGTQAASYVGLMNGTVLCRVVVNILTIRPCS